MWIALSLLAGLLLVVLVYLLSFDGRFRVERSREIAAPTDRVFAAVADLRTWPAWSPWLLYEPDAEIVYGDN
ncbi:MAG TPA: SRPBCC family protein, partial [Gammaproteobacteria bacterium]